MSGPRSSERRASLLAPNLRRRAVLLPALVAAFALASCIDLGPSSGDVQSIQLDSSMVPFPAVVAGDSMRDSSGIVRPLRAFVFNGSGDTIPDAPIFFVTRDTILTVSLDGIVVAKTFRDAPANVYASTGSLQSLPVTIQVTRRPDTLSLNVFNDSLTILDGKASTAIGTLLQNRATTGGLQPVPKWVVSYRVEYHGRTLTEADSGLARFITPEDTISPTPTFRAAPLDTTSGDGRTARVLYIQLSALTRPLDSLVVSATARYRGQPIAGSPVQVVVHVRQ